MANIIKLNVGGKIFITRKSTLSKSPFLSALLSQDMNDKLDDALFIDDDPLLFQHVLNHMRYSNYTIPTDMVDNVVVLLDFYGLKFKKEDKNNVNKNNVNVVNYGINTNCLDLDRKYMLSCNKIHKIKFYIKKELKDLNIRIDKNKYEPYPFEGSFTSFVKKCDETNIFTIYELEKAYINMLNSCIKNEPTISFYVSNRGDNSHIRWLMEESYMEIIMCLS